MRAAPWGEERDGCVGEEGGQKESGGERRQRARREEDETEDETRSGDRRGDRRREAWWRMRGEKNYAKRLSRIC